MIKRTFAHLFLTFVLISCHEPTAQANNETEKIDTSSNTNEIKLNEDPIPKKTKAEDIVLVKDLTFEKYTLEDKYEYNKKPREFQWDKIKERLAYIENFQKEYNDYGVVSNYKNKNGEAATVQPFERNEYKRLTDTLGTERYQSAPLYLVGENTPLLYARDGSLVKILSKDDAEMMKVKGLTNFEGEWEIPHRYVKSIGDSNTFKQIIVVDVTNQNICTLEQEDNKWIVRSMNPSTTGKHNPPYGMKTPVGIYVIQEQKPKMFYYKDGTTTIHGYAPWASRFTNGAYIHGVPTADPKAKIIEYSSTLGTIPRSHMCVRNASSHAKYIYDWAKPHSSLVIVID